MRSRLLSFKKEDLLKFKLKVEIKSSRNENNEKF